MDQNKHLFPFNTLKNRDGLQFTTITILLYLSLPVDHSWLNIFPHWTILGKLSVHGCHGEGFIEV